MLSNKWFTSVVFLCALGSSALGLTVDDFSVGGFEQSLNMSNPDFSFAQDGLNPNSVIGGRRESDIWLNYPVADDDGAFFNVNFGNFPDRFGVVVGPTTELEYFGLSWGLENTQFGPPSQALNADLLADGADRFRIFVCQSYNANLRLTLRSGVDEDSANWGSVYLNLPDDRQFSEYWIDVEFSQFPDIDFTDVDYISLGDGVVSGYSFLSLDSIVTIPEPCTMMLMGIGGLVLLRRKK